MSKALRPDPHAPLTAKQRRFVQEFCACHNACEAARKAGYAPTNVRQQSAELMKKPQIRRAIAEALGPVAERLELTADRVLEGLRNIAFADIRKALKAIGVTLPDELDDETAFAVKEIIERTYHTQAGGEVTERRVVMLDRLAALNALGRVFAIFKDGRPLGDGEIVPGVAAVPGVMDSETWLENFGPKARDEAT